MQVCTISFPRKKAPGFLCGLAKQNVSMTIGGLLPGQKHTCTAIPTKLFCGVIEGKGWTKVEDEIVEWEAGDAGLHPVLGLASAPKP